MFNSSMSRDGIARDSLFRATLLVVVILAILAFRAAFSAYFMLDDFGMLTISRFLDNPFDPFIQDQFPGGLYYRPLGMLLWWLSERAFGAEPLGHYLLNLLLHGLVAIALGTLVKRLCGSRWAGLIVAAVFVLHPIGVGSALWLSDRFDLLALLFGLLGLHAALQFSLNQNRRSLWATLILLGLSLLSKEIALACITGVGMLWLCATDGSSVSRRVVRCLYLLLPVAIYFLARALILNHSTILSLMSRGDPAHLFIDGIQHWLAGWMDYFPFWAHLDGWKKILSIGATATLILLGLISTRLAWTASRRQTFFVGIAIWLTSGLLQWPLLAHFSVRLGEIGNTVDTVVNTRLFYTSLAGLLIALAALLVPLTESIKGRRWLAVMTMALLVPWFSASQNLARRHRIQTQNVESVVTSANAAIAKLELPSKGCQIYLLDIDAWSFKWISDEAVKATYPDLPRIAGCLVQTEHTPWYHIAMLDSLDKESLRPMTINGNATQLSSLRDMGRAKMLFLNLDARSVIATDSQAKFLSWQGGDFTDVTVEVLSGRRKPAFVCNRSESECPH